MKFGVGDRVVTRPGRKGVVVAVTGKQVRILIDKTQDESPYLSWHWAKDLTKEEKVMASVNKVALLGRLGRDPETKETKTGNNMCKFSVATDGRDGETDWHNVVCFGALAENCGKYLTKGRQVYLEGKLTYNKYVKDDVKCTSTSIMAFSVTFLGSNDGEQKKPVAPENYVDPQTDEIPF